MAKIQVTMIGTYEIPEDRVKEYYDVDTVDEAVLMDAQMFSEFPAEALEAILHSGDDIEVHTVNLNG